LDLYKIVLYNNVDVNYSYKLSLTKNIRMFGIGAGEILIILLVTLLVLGPKEIPKVARAIGKAMKDINRFKDELRKSVDLEFEDYEKEDNKIIDNKTQIKDKEDTTN